MLVLFKQHDMRTKASGIDTIYMSYQKVRAYPLSPIFVISSTKHKL